MARFNRDGKYSISESGSPTPRRNCNGNVPDCSNVRWSTELGPWCLQVSSPIDVERSTSRKMDSYKCAPVKSVWFIIVCRNSVSVKDELARLAWCKLDRTKRARFRLVLARLAPLNWAPLRSVSLSVVWTRSARDKSAMIIAAPLRVAVLKLASVSRASVSVARLRSAANSDELSRVAFNKLALASRARSSRALRKFVLEKSIWNSWASRRSTSDKSGNSVLSSSRQSFQERTPCLSRLTCSGLLRR